jgi:Ulp1 family protease
LFTPQDYQAVLKSNAQQVPMPPSKRHKSLAQSKHDPETTLLERIEANLPNKPSPTTPITNATAHITKAPIDDDNTFTPPSLQEITLFQNQHGPETTLLERIEANFGDNPSATIPTNNDATLHTTTSASHDVLHSTQDPEGVDPDGLLAQIINEAQLQQALQSLLPQTEWLNDLAIDFHLAMIIDQYPRPHNLKSLSSHFYRGLVDPFFSYKRIQRWITRLDLFPNKQVPSSAKLFIPIHCHGDHWVLAFIFFDNCTFGYYDSMNHRRTTLATNLRSLVIAIHQQIAPLFNFNISQWTDLDNIPGPRQTNGYDCGMFLSLAARHMLTNHNLDTADFIQNQMPHWRHTISDELVVWRQQQLHAFQI